MKDMSKTVTLIEASSEVPHGHVRRKSGYVYPECHAKVKFYDTFFDISNAFQVPSTRYAYMPSSDNPIVNLTDALELTRYSMRNNFNRMHYAIFPF